MLGDIAHPLSASNLCPTCRVFGTMIPHAPTVSPRSLRVAMVLSSLCRSSMMPVRGSRGRSPTGGLTSFAAVDMSPIAVPVDDELVVTDEAPEYQSLQPNLGGAENWTFDPAGLTLGPAQRACTGSNLERARCLPSPLTLHADSLALLHHRRHFSAWLRRQAGCHTPSLPGSASSPRSSGEQTAALPFSPTHRGGGGPSRIIR